MEHTGTASFEIDVPYRLLERGAGREKPLIIYLHGFGQHMNSFQSQVAPLTTLSAYHLFVSGPYPIYDRRRKKKVDEWGRAWYLYDGEQEQFERSLEQSAAFIEGVLDQIGDDIAATRMAVMGYSMGGYLAGYFALSRPGSVDELVVMGSRIKTELFEDRPGSYSHLSVLALHGRKDRRVKSNPQRLSCEKLSKWGATVTFKTLAAGHKLDPPYISAAKEWLMDHGYG
ncbi:alpha/beta hydrolase [Fodinibius sediminis]|nr:alpha/beta fold hydrolase [Fodinibius sediminis]